MSKKTSTSDDLKRIFENDLNDASKENKKDVANPKKLDESGVEIYRNQSGVEVDEDFKAPDELLKAQALANTLDSAVKLPFINFRVGLDSLIGLIPGIGDTIMLLASIRIIYLGKKIGVPKDLQNKMFVNSMIDYALGLFPIVGDIIDVFFKANQRNVRIMEQWWVAENKEKIDALVRKQYEKWQRENEHQ